MKGVAEAKAHAAAELLALKNDFWLDEGESPLDAATFVGSLALSGVNAFPNGTFEVYFDDGDLFWGHSVRVDVEAGGLVHAGRDGGIGGGGSVVTRPDQVPRDAYHAPTEISRTYPFFVRRSPSWTRVVGQDTTATGVF